MAGIMENSIFEDKVFLRLRPIDPDRGPLHPFFVPGRLGSSITVLK
jgi:hypothetical protein